MKLLVNLFQPVKCNVRVDLRGGYVCVSQNGLHRAQIGAVPHHVRGTTMAQHVRTCFLVRL